MAGPASAGARARALVAYFVHGRGRGHAARALTISAALEAEGHRVALFTGGDALDLLRGDPARELVEVEPVLPGLSALRSFPRRLVGDLRALRGLAPAVIISDGDAPSVRAGRRLGIPVISVGHDQLFLRCRLPAELPRGRVAYERVVAGLTSAGADAAVAVHFLPAEPKDPGVRVARPDIPETLMGEVLDDGTIVAYLRDGVDGGALAAAAGRGHRVVVFGDVDRAPAGIERRPFDRAGFHRALRSCRAVVATAGSNLLAECIVLGKPILALHRRGDHEQRLNGLLAAAAGVGEVASIDGPELGAQVDAFLRRVEARDFGSVDLKAVLSPVSVAVTELVGEVVGQPVA